jgi:hypothetical protein
VNPEDLIGHEAVARLRLGGFEIVPKPPAEPKLRARFTCPHCGFSSFGGKHLNAYAEWGQVWHEPCVPFPPPPPYERGKERPMLKTYEPA